MQLSNELKPRIINVTYNILILVSTILILTFCKKWFPNFPINLNLTTLPIIFLALISIAYYQKQPQIALAISIGLFTFLSIQLLQVLQLPYTPYLLPYTFIILAAALFATYYFYTTKSEKQNLQELLLATVIFAYSVHVCNTIFSINVLNNIAVIPLYIYLYITENMNPFYTKQILYQVVYIIPIAPAFLFLIYILISKILKRTNKYFVELTSITLLLQFISFYLYSGMVFQILHTSIQIFSLTGTAIDIASSSLTIVFLMLTVKEIASKTTAKSIKAINMFLTAKLFTNTTIFLTLTLQELISILIYLSILLAYILSLNEPYLSKLFLFSVLTTEIVISGVSAISTSEVLIFLNEALVPGILGIVAAEILSPIIAQIRLLTEGKKQEKETKNEKLQAYIFSLKEKYDDIEQTVKPNIKDYSIDLKEITVKSIVLLIAVITVVASPILLSFVYPPLKISIEAWNIRTINIYMLLTITVILSYILWRRKP